MFLKKFGKKGMVEGLRTAPALIMLLVVIGIVGAIGLAVISGVGDGFDANSAEQNVTNTIVEAINNFFELAPVLGTVFIAVILLAAVALLLYFGYMKNQ